MSTFILDSLLSKGYVVIKAIEVDGKVRYLKTYNPHGVGVYVYIDEDQYVAVESKNRFVVKKIQGNSLPIPSSYVNALEKVSDASGMVYECQDKLCTIMRNNEGGFTTPSFQVHRAPEKAILVDDEIMGYPLVLYSEIMSDAEEALQRSTEVSQFIRQREVGLAERESDVMATSLSKLLDTVNDMASESIRLIEKMDKQKKILSEVLDSGDLSAADAVSVRANVFVRELLDRKIIALQKNTFSFQKEISRVLATMQDNLRAVKEVNEMVGTSHDPNIITLDRVSNI